MSDNGELIQWIARHSNIQDAITAGNATEVSTLRRNRTVEELVVVDLSRRLRARHHLTMSRPEGMNVPVGATRGTVPLTVPATPRGNKEPPFDPLDALDNSARLNVQNRFHALMEDGEVAHMAPNSEPMMAALDADDIDSLVQEHLSHSRQVLGQWSSVTQEEKGSLGF